jgi:PadR family transcriptional regulator PadR
MDAERELLKGNTPTLILAVLRDGPRHGYGVAREIERRSESALRCREGTLYPALHALEQQGLVASEWRRDGQRERKIYALTPAGAAALDERSRTWERFATAIQRVITGGSDGETATIPGRSAPLARPELEPAG